MDRRRAPPPDVVEDDEARAPREAYGRADEERPRDRRSRDTSRRRDRDWGERDADVIIERRPAPVPFFGIFGR
jgi:hypothetical protein